jgi:flagellar basal body-associated protein FliL
MSSADTAPAPSAGRRKWLALAVLVLPAMLLFMMLSILFVAMPSMAADLSPSSTAATAATAAAVAAVSAVLAAFALRHLPPTGVATDAWRTGHP